MGTLNKEFFFVILLSVSWSHPSLVSFSSSFCFLAFCSSSSKIFSHRSSFSFSKSSISIT